MFGNSQKKIYAPADGKAVPLECVPDEVFSSGMLGKGFAVEPTSGNIYSPIAGTVVGISETKHAYTLKSLDGIEILVHVGIDTVKLGGKDFIPMVRVSDEIKAGDMIARAELSSIRAAGFKTVIPVVIANSDELDGIRFKYGETKGGKTVCATYPAVKVGKI